MRDLTDRALDTAARSGRDVRRRPGRPPARRVDRGQVRPRRRRRLGRERGVRRPRPRRWRVGLREPSTASTPPRPTGSPPRPSGSPGRRATALRDRSSLDDRPPAHGTYETPVVEDPFTVPLETKIADLLAADEAAARVKGIAFTESSYAAQREWKTFAASDGSFTEQTITHVGVGRRGERDRGRRAPAPELPGRRRRLAGGRLRVRPRRSTSPATPRRCAEEAVALLTRAAVPAGPADDRPRPVAALPPGPRDAAAIRPSSIASSGPRRRYAGTSFLTTDKLDEGFRYGSDLIDDRRRRDGAPAGWARSAGTTRASRPRPCRSIKDGIFVGYLTQPRDGAADRPAVAAGRCGPTAGTGSR